MSGCEGVALELIPLFVSVCVKSLGEDTHAVSILPGAGPRDQEVSIVVQRDCGVVLRRRRVGIDLKFISKWIPICIKLTGEYAPVVPVLIEAMPTHHEKPRVSKRDGRLKLATSNVCIDLELASNTVSTGIKSLGEDSV